MDLGSVCPARLTVQSRSDALKLEDEAASKTSAAYRSPELTTAPLPPCNIDERVDSWGLGCTMYALAFGRSPFETPKEGVLRLAIMNAKYSIPPNRTNSRGVVYSVEYINMVEKLLSLDLNQRPYMTEVIAFCEDRLLHS
jgi:serine/threonine kinase 16